MLGLCRRFFEFLDQQNIRYCHWKSNERLEEALGGKTDLDILVHVDDVPAFQAALKSYDFKGILSQPEKRFPGLEDYLGFDDATGDLVHLHAHYRLILGQKYIKNHHLPLESLVFDNLTKKRGINIPCAEIELVLLIIRAHLKTDLISLGKHALKGMIDDRYTAFPKDIEDELRELHRRSDPQKFTRILHESGLPLSERQCNRFLLRLSQGKLRSRHIMMEHLNILRQLQPYKRSTKMGVYFTYFRHFIRNLPIVSNVRPYKAKTLMGPGKVFSIVGADGSGKSTLVNDLSKWLSWKMTVSTYYYGIPKNWVRTFSAFGVTFFKKLGFTSTASRVGDLYWLYVARYRKYVFDETQKDVGENKIAITDRFPLIDFRGMDEPMDNPRIDAAGTFLGKNLSELEENFYNGISLSDHVFILKVDIDELRKRKTDITLDKHRLKAAAVNSVMARASIVFVDANNPYQEVLLEVKRHIWKAL